MQRSAIVGTTNRRKAAVTETNPWSAEGYDHHARFVSELAGGVFDWLAPKPGERILDLGCGDGALTERIVAAGASVLGIDHSPSMLDAARERGMDVRSGDARQLDFDTEFDAVFSNAALHWVTEADLAVAGIARALKPGGRFVAEFGGHGNVATIVTAMRAAAQIHGGEAGLAHPWYFPTPEQYGALLQDHGFTVHRIALIPRPTPLPTGMQGWLATFRQPFFDQFPQAHRAAVLETAVSLMEPSLRDCKGNWTADYVRIRLEARLGPVADGDPAT